MVRFPSNVEYGYILVYFPNDSMSNRHRAYNNLANSNVTYKITSYDPFKWVCIKHRINSPSNIAHTSIKKLIGGILLDCCSFNLNVTFEDIHLKLIENFNYAGQHALSKQLCKTVDEDYYDFINNHIDDKNYFFPV